MNVKINRTRKKDPGRPNALDFCQTPPYALDPIIPYIFGVIWECAAGEGLMAWALMKRGLRVVATDIITGQDFFCWEPSEYDYIVTNPPYSKKFAWLERCYELGKPFALLLPIDTLGSKRAQRLFDKHGIEILFLNHRVNFKMPYKGWDGNGAWFPVAWFTHGLNIGRQMTFSEINLKANGDGYNPPETFPYQEISHESR